MLIEIWDMFFCLMLYLGIFDSERGKTFQPRCQGFLPGNEVKILYVEGAHTRYHVTASKDT